MTTKPSELRDWLTRYKGRNDDEDPFEQASFDNVKAIVGRYLLESGEQLWQRYAPIDGLVVVPSHTSTRTPPHPLELLLDELNPALPRLNLLRQGPGEITWRKSAKDGYLCDPASPALRVLLVDDLFVTGASIFSAAYALRAAGHNVVGGMAIARRVNRDWGDCQQMWDQQAQIEFDWATSPLLAQSCATALTQAAQQSGSSRASA